MYLCPGLERATAVLLKFEDAEFEDAEFDDAEFEDAGGWRMP